MIYKWSTLPHLSTYYLYDFIFMKKSSSPEKSDLHMPYAEVTEWTPEVRRSDVYFRGPVLVIGSHHQMEVETSTYEK